MINLTNKEAKALFAVLSSEKLADVSIIDKKYYYLRSAERSLLKSWYKAAIDKILFEISKPSKPKKDGKIN